MRQGSFHARFPNSSAGHARYAPLPFSFPVGSILIPSVSAHDADKRSFFQHLAAAHAGALGNMLDARFAFFVMATLPNSSNRSTRCWSERLSAPGLVITAFVLLARDGQVAVGIVFDLNVLAALLLGFLIGIRLSAFTFCRSAGLFQGGFQREELLEGNFAFFFLFFLFHFLLDLV